MNARVVGGLSVATALSGCPPRVNGRLEVAVGIGCQRGAALDTLAGAVDAALRDLGPVTVRCLASHRGKAGEPALRALAEARGWPLAVYPVERLASVPVPNPSARVAAEVAAPSVAEAAALLAAGANWLVVPKRRSVGPDGKAVIVAVAPWCGGAPDPDPSTCSCPSS